MAAQPNKHSVSVSESQHAAWVAGRVRTLLSHYFQPDQPIEVQDAALEDWAEMLTPYSRQAIEYACTSYLRDQPRRRPTPGDIRVRAIGHRTAPSVPREMGDRSALSYDELDLLENKILPTARRWCTDFPELREHGMQTLEFWGEQVPELRQ